MTTRTNNVINPSFEVDLTGWVSNETTKYDTLPTLQRNTSQANFGTCAIEVIAGVNNSSGTYILRYGVSSTGTTNAQTTPIAAGQTATVSYYVKASSATSVFLYSRITFFDAAGAVASAPSSALYQITTSWNRKSLQAVAPPNAVSYGFAVEQQSSGLNGIYFDGFLSEVSTTLGNYFDGSTVQTGYTYAWTGTAHASTSTESDSSAPTLSPAVSVGATVTTALSSHYTLASPVSAGVTASTVLGPRYTLASPVAPDVTVTTLLVNGGSIEVPASVGVSTTTALSPSQNRTAAVGADVTVATALSAHRNLAVPVSLTGTVSTGLDNGEPPVADHFYLTVPVFAEVITYTELGYVDTPAPLGSASLGKLVSFNVSTSAVPLNPAEGSGAAPSVNAGYIKGTDPEFALGETNVLSHGAVGTYEGEIVRLSLPEGSDVASISQDTALTLLNNELSLFPFIDAAPSVWTAARAIDYWTQQCGLFYDKVPGDCIAYASGFGHTDSYGAGTTARFYEKAVGGTTATQILNGRSVKTLGSAVTGTTAFHELPEASVPVSVPTNRKLVASVGLGLRGTGRATTVTWNLLDAKGAAYSVTISATSAGLISAAVSGVPVDSVTVSPDADYRVTFSIERVSSTAVVGKLSVHTDDLAGTGTLDYSGAGTSAPVALPAVLQLTSITHASAGGSGAQMLRWGTYLTVATQHPLELPVVQKAFSATVKEFGFVSGFDGNVWALLNEYCAITRQDVSFLDAKLTVTPRIMGLSAPRGNFSRFSRDSERREKYKQVAVVNKQSVANTSGTAVFWRADSVYQINPHEVQEFTVQTDHSILSVNNPVPVPGIEPFPYKEGTGQYVVTGADGYIIAPQWWTDNGGNVEVSLTGKEGEINIKITAPRIDSVRAPYRISEGAADRPALYVSGSGILNDPKEVHVGTGAKNAKEGFDNVFESPFIAGVMETYDTAAAMAAQYSASNADVSFEVPNDFYTPSRFGQYPAGARFTDGKRNYRITDASQSHSKVSGNAVPHTTIGEYVASYPAGATIADEKARHAGRTIKQFNISPLKGQ